MLTWIWAIALAIPWLNPFTSGPSVSMWQWVTTGVCASSVIASAALIPRTDVRETLKCSMALSWLVAGTLSSVIGVLQYAGLAHHFFPWLNTASMGEAYANLRQRNQFATLANMALVSLFWLAQRRMNVGPEAQDAATRGLSKGAMTTGIWTFLATGLAALAGLGNATSASRTGLLQLLAIVLMAWWWGRGKWNEPHWRATAWVTLSALVAYGAASFLLPLVLGTNGHGGNVIARLNDGEINCSSRLVLWSNVLQLIAQKPWTGWGWGELDYAHFMTVYPGDRFCEILDNAHNLPLHIAVELGVPVAFTAVAAVAALVWKSKPWCEQNSRRQLAWSVLLLIGLHSMVEYPLWYGPFELAAISCIWMLGTTDAQPHDEPFTAQNTNALVHWQIASALGLILFVATAWEYWRISQIYLQPSQRSAAYRDDALKAVGASWMFREQVRFAELGLTPLTQLNALEVNQLAKDLLHFSPEPFVVERVIESAILQGNDAEAAYYLQRLKLAYPEAYKQWSAKPHTPN